MSKRRTKTIMAIGGIILLLGAGGIFVVNNIKGSSDNNSKMLLAAKEYEDNGEFDKALGILEALLTVDSDNDDLKNRIAELKKKALEYSNRSAAERVAENEQRILELVDQLMVSMESALENSQLKKAPLLVAEIYKIDPGNTVAERLADLLRDELLKVEIKKERAQKLVEDIAEALKNRDADAVEKKILEFRAEINSALDLLNNSKVDELADELSRLDKDNPLIREYEDSKQKWIEDIESLNSRLTDLARDIDETLEPDKDIAVKLEEIDKAEEIAIQAEEFVLERDIDSAVDNIYESLKLDPENDKAQTLNSLIDKNLESVDLEISRNNYSSSDDYMASAIEAIKNNRITSSKNNIMESLEKDSENSDAEKLLNMIKESENNLIADVEEMRGIRKDDKDVDGELTGSSEDQTALADDLPEVDEYEDEIFEDEVPEDVEPESEDIDEETTDESELIQEAVAVIDEISIDELSDLAAAYSKQKEYEKQIEVLDQILDMEPGADFYVKAGIASYKLKKYDQAVGYFNQAIDHDPDFSGTYYPMALSYEKLNNNSDREQMLKRSLKLRPDHAATNYELGRLYSDSGEYEKSLEHFIKALSLKKESIKYQLGVALAYYNVEEYEKSIAIYDTIIDSGKEISEVYYNLSLAGIKTGNLEGAFANISRAIELKSNVPSYYYTSGEISEALGRVEEAALFYVEALKLDHTYYKPMLNLGNIYDRLGRYQDSVNLLKGAYALNPNDSNAAFSLGTAYLHNKEYSNALTYLKESYEKDNTSEIKLFTLSLAYTEIGDKKAAEEGYREVISLNPDYHDAYYYLGQLLYSEGRIDEAKPLFLKVLKLNPEYRFKSEIEELL